MAHSRLPLALLLSPLLSPVLSPVLATISTPAPVQAQGLEGNALQKALNDKAAAFWVYDDLEKAYGMARKSGKPLLVSFRCVP